jgi:hypothetical protein
MNKEILMVPTNSHSIFLGLIIFNNLMSFFDSLTIIKFKKKKNFGYFKMLSNKNAHVSKGYFQNRKMIHLVQL